MSKTKNPIAATMEHMMPVGTIIEWCPVEGSGVDLSTPAKVAAYYGFGTWEAYGQGRMLLGADNGHAANSIGGEAEVTLQKAQIPEYLDVVYVDGNSGSNPGIAGGVVYSGSNWEGTVSCPLNNNGGQPHNNMPPYIAVYRWRRIA